MLKDHNNRKPREIPDSDNLNNHLLANTADFFGRDTGQLTDVSGPGVKDCGPKNVEKITCLGAERKQKLLGKKLGFK